LGTFVRVTTASCGDAVLAAPGTVVLQGEVSDAGTPVSAEGLLVALRSSSFDRLRARAGADAALYADSVEASPIPRGPYSVASAIRKGLIRSTDDLPSATAAMIRGASIGDTSTFTPATLDVFRRSGLSHVLAVSGTNVAIVMGALLLVLKRMGVRLQAAAGAFGIVLFVLVVGPEPSVLRAAVMAGISLLALVGGRTAESFRALAVALIVLIAIQPGLVRSIGLHLSAAATGGIVLFAPAISRRLIRLPEQLSLPLAAGISAQVAVAPLLAAGFGSLPVIGLLSNLLALPAVAPVTLLGICSATVGALYLPAGRVFGRLAQPFAAWILWVARTTGSWSFSSLEVPPWFALVLAGPVVAAALWSVWGRE
jgi:competence protein ComEC